MNLNEFPRPKNDNGMGIHFSASIYPPNDITTWVNRCRDMHLKWVKILDDSGGSSLPLFKAIIQASMMPVVRLYRNQPNPGTIGMREQDTIKRMVDIADHAVYIETNNEPDLGVEWKDGKKPANWMDVVVDNFIADADMVLSAGGLPAFPALGPGSVAKNMFEWIKERDGLDLFNKIWVAIHNYCGGRPLEYPNDPVHQLGKPLTQAEYDATGGMWAWEMPLEQVNAIRLKDKKPGETIMTDATCFRAFERFNADIVAVCGHSVPIMMTEGGYDVGQRFCARYAKPTPQRMSEMTLRMMKFMAREETIDYEPGGGNKSCPDYYFASMPWLIAAYQMGHPAPQWEVATWFTDWYNKDFGLHGELPIVQMLRNYNPNPLPPPPMPPDEFPVDYLAAIWKPSPNHCVRNMSINAVILHATGGSAQASINWMQERASLVSVHYLISKYGTVYQLVREANVAYHAGVSDHLGLRNWNGFSIGIELENLDDGKDPYPDLQIAALAALLRSIVGHYGIEREMVVTHAQVAYPPGRKVDPRSLDVKGILDMMYGVGATPVQQGLTWDPALVALRMIKLVPAIVNSGEKYWKLIEARWMPPGNGKINIFYRVQDLQGQFLAGIEGRMRNGGTAYGKTKGAGDGFYGDFPMYAVLGAYTVDITENGYPSDAVSGMGLGTPENPQLAIHTGFDLVFRLATKESEPVPPIPTEFDVIGQKLLVAGQAMVIPLNKDAAFWKYAQTHGGGERLTREFDFEIDGIDWRAQIFENKILFAKIGEYDKIYEFNRTN